MRSAQKSRQRGVPYCPRGRYETLSSRGPEVSLRKALHKRVTQIGLDWEDIKSGTAMSL